LVNANSVGAHFQKHKADFPKYTKLM